MSGLVSLTGSVTVTAAVLEALVAAAFPGWTLRFMAGRWWATRSGTFSSVGALSLLRPVVMADDLEGLAEQLGIQACLDLLPDDDLEALWLQVTGEAS